MLKGTDSVLSLNLCLINRSTPSELFYDVVMDLEDEFEKEKNNTKDIAIEVGVNVVPEMKFDDFVAKINEHPRFESINEAHIEQIFVEVVEFRSTFDSFF
jgi:hypothetical protein